MRGTCAPNRATPGRAPGAQTTTESAWVPQCRAIHTTAIAGCSETHGTARLRGRRVKAAEKRIRSAAARPASLRPRQASSRIQARSNMKMQKPPSADVRKPQKSAKAQPGRTSPQALRPLRKLQQTQLSYADLRTDQGYRARCRLRAASAARPPRLLRPSARPGR